MILHFGIRILIVGGVYMTGLLLTAGPAFTQSEEGGQFERKTQRKQVFEVRSPRTLLQKKSSPQTSSVLFRAVFYGSDKGKRVKLAPPQGEQVSFHASWK